jgi:hypothetical protein
MAESDDNVAEPSKRLAICIDYGVLEHRGKREGRTARLRSNVIGHAEISLEGVKPFDVMS